MLEWAFLKRGAGLKRNAKPSARMKEMALLGEIEGAIPREEANAASFRERKGKKKEAAVCQDAFPRRRLSRMSDASDASMRDEAGLSLALTGQPLQARLLAIPRAPFHVGRC